MALFFTARDPVYNDIDQFFDTLVSPSLFTTTSSNNASTNNKLSRKWTSPSFARLDLTETDTSYVLHADLPGLTKDQIDVSVKDDVVTISGERKANSEVKDEHKHVIERSYGKFTRTLRLPQDADTEKIQAKLENGVLELVIGKGKPEESVRKVTVA